MILTKNFFKKKSPSSALWWLNFLIKIIIWGMWITSLWSCMSFGASVWSNYLWCLGMLEHSKNGPIACMQPAGCWQPTSAMLDNTYLKRALIFGTYWVLCLCGDLNLGSFSEVWHFLLTGLCFKYLTAFLVLWDSGLSTIQLQLGTKVQ